MHQVNLEYLAKGVLSSADGVYYPDTLVGTDSHTTMINGIGIVGWGVGGIEAEAGMLGQPVYFLTPDVVGVHLTGALREGVTATDLARPSPSCCADQGGWQVCGILGPGRRTCRSWTAPPSPTWRPNTGATMGFFPIDAGVRELPAGYRTLRSPLRPLQDLLQGPGTLGHSGGGSDRLPQVVELDLATVKPSVAGPKRPQDRIELPNLRREFFNAVQRPVTEVVLGRPARPSAEGGRQTAAGRRRRWAPDRSSSRPSPVAPTPAIRASCWRRDCSPRRRSRRAEG